LFTRVAKTVEEAQQLIEAGFEYVCDIDNVKLFRKKTSGILVSGKFS
jgi:hypothetical protein